MTDKVSPEMLRVSAAVAGIAVHDRGDGFFRVHSPSIRVDVWEAEGHRSCYVEQHCDPWHAGGLEEAIRLACTPPARRDANSRPKRPQPDRMRALKAHAVCRDAQEDGSVLCHWCRVPLAPAHMTLDHMIPLARGGVNTLRNLVVACEACNRWRASEMPELVDRYSSFLAHLEATKSSGCAPRWRGQQRGPFNAPPISPGEYALRRAVDAYVIQIAATATPERASGFLDPRRLAGLIRCKTPRATIRVSDAPSVEEPKPTRPIRPLPTAPSPRPAA